MLNKIENQLKTIAESFPEGKIKDSVTYSLLDGGKRIRPQIVITTSQNLNGNEEAALQAACALEMIHTYSLIHDDLPALDDDNYRRHKLTNHKVFGEDIAILAGDTLLSESFSVIANIEIADVLKVELLSALTKNVGIHGMILGQQYDILEQEQSIKDIDKTYILKTGKLFACALVMGVVCANRLDLVKKAQELGELIGLYFQYQDDILDVSGDINVLGKDIQSDIKRNKPTIFTFLQKEEIESKMDAMKNQIDTLIMELEIPEINDILESMYSRNK